jgi:hypothetical protein
MKDQLDVCVLDLGDQPVDSEHELLSVPIWAICQQRASMCHEHVIAPIACPALYLTVAHMHQAADVIGTPCMPKGGEHVFERYLGGESALHVAVQHSTCARRDDRFVMTALVLGSMQETPADLARKPAPSPWTPLNDAATFTCVTPAASSRQLTTSDVIPIQGSPRQRDMKLQNRRRR